MRNSLYWDDFEKRANETIYCIKQGKDVPIGRVAIFITNKCNLKCEYCNAKDCSNQEWFKTLPENKFVNILDKYGKDAIIHITGGEPSVVNYLYPFIKENGHKYRLHLNTNAIITPPAKHLKRLKISLDSSCSEEWDKIVGLPGAWRLVTKNIKYSMMETVTSLTYTLSKNNYLDSIKFAKFARQEFKELYAIFFSVYKGCNPKFAMSKEDSDIFFESILPNLKNELPSESLALITETIDEKRRIIQGERFEQSMKTPCYLSMSERVFDPDGNEYTCSHLYRDGIYNLNTVKNEKCKYGCNQRLVKFNEYVESLI